MANNNVPASDNRRSIDLLKGLLLFLLVFAAYWPALHGQFIWDDLFVVGKSPLMTGELNLRTIWFHIDFPLSTVVLWLERCQWDNQTTGYHVVNFGLHALNAALVWRMLTRLKAPGAWLAAALFAVHPVCVASVAWISEIKNTLSLVFFLLSVGCYLRFDEAVPDPPIRTRRSWYWFSLMTFVLALLSKTSTVMLPVVLLACAWWRHGRLDRRDWIRTIPFFAFALGFGSMSVWFQAHQTFTVGVVQSENLFGRLAGAGMALWFYLGKALAPLNLAMIYPHWTINATALTAYLPLLGWCFLFYIGWWARHSWGRPLLFALVCFTATLFPVLGFFDLYYLAISRVSDHFEYLPLICVLALVAARLSSALPPAALRWIAPTLLLALGLLTVNRAKIFATDEKLWEDTLRKNPASWTAHNNLGTIRAEQGRMDEAMNEFKLSLRLNPQNAQAHVNLGWALGLQQKFAEAEAQFQAALTLKPADPGARRFYGQALAEQGKIPEAIVQLREAQRLQANAETQQQLELLLKATTSP